jgi:UDP-N-acetyl-D-mannosaminuronic acid dehydrogenase
MLTGGFSRDVCVIGGGGHVGLPLALTFADAGLRTVIYDINRDTVAKIRSGKMPFMEEGGQEMLERALKRGTLEIEDAPTLLSDCHFLVLIVGTPVDEHLNPSFTAIKKAVDQCAQQLRKDQIMILRSTVFPGITQHIQAYLDEKNLGVKVAFCPERVAQGYSIREFKQLPQIISAFDPQVIEKVKQLFGRFTPEFIEMLPMEAELCKLMTNAWRYIQFATVNQFYMIATQHGLDFSRILHGCRHNYPRMAGMPGPGFAAGPCLVKDTMQLAAFSHNNFVLGHAAMLINEGLPTHLLLMAKQNVKNLSSMTCGILGMAFKSESDDHRDSLSYKLKKLLTLESKQVLCTDPYVRDPSLVPLEQVMQEADILFIGAPHKIYRRLVIPSNKELVDVWDCVETRENLRGLIHEGIGDGVGGIYSRVPGAGTAPVGTSGHRS